MRAFGDVSQGFSAKSRGLGSFLTGPNTVAAFSLCATAWTLSKAQYLAGPQNGGLGDAQFSPSAAKHPKIRHPKCAIGAARHGLDWLYLAFYQKSYHGLSYPFSFKSMSSCNLATSTGRTVSTAANSARNLLQWPAPGDGGPAAVAGSSRSQLLSCPGLPDALYGATVGAAADYEDETSFPVALRSFEPKSKAPLSDGSTLKKVR